MRTETITRELYQFDELDDDAKEKARSWYRDGAYDYEWWDGVYDDAKSIGVVMGIDIDDIYFSGFSSQGDGACFTGSYAYNPGALKGVMREYPKDKELHEIARNLQDLQRRWFYQLTATVRHQGYYYHSLCTAIDVQADDGIIGYDRDITDAEEGISEYLRDFMYWVYKALEREWDWLNSDEIVDENIKCNEYEFTVDGGAA